MGKFYALGLCVVCLVLLPNCVNALPGERAQSVKLRLMRSDRFIIKQSTSLNSDLPIYNATTRWLGAEVLYSFGNDPNGRIKSESIAYEKSLFVFKKNLVALGIVRMTAGAEAESDFSSARLVATTKTWHSSLTNFFYRGRFFGYVSSGTVLLIVQLPDPSTAIKQSRICEARACGD